MKSQYQLRLWLTCFFLLSLLCSVRTLPLTITLKLTRKEVPLNLSESHEITEPHNLLRAHSNNNNLCALLPKPKKSNGTTPAEISEPCLIQNLFYTAEASPQRMKMALRIDLSSSWTWVKDKTCERCWESPKSGKKVCKKSCEFGAFNTTYTCEEKELCNLSRGGEKGKINTQLGTINGRFIVNDFPLEDNDEGELNVLLLKKFKFLAVNKIEGLREFFADGVLGLGRENGEEGSSGTEALEYMVHADSIKRDKKFSLHITPTDDQDFFLILAGLDEDYISKNEDKIVKLDLKKEGSLWSVLIKSISSAMPVFRDDNQGGKTLHHYEKMISNLNNTVAYFSLETTFISLPENVLVGFIKMLNKEENAECEILARLGGIVHCKRLLFPQHFYQLSFEISFDGLEKPVSLYPNTLIKECIHRNQSEKVYECFFNLHVSKDGKIVLGEAFLKNFYTIFDSKNNEMYLTPPANTDYFKPPIVKPKKYGFFINAALVLIVILIIVISPFYIRKAYLWAKQRFQRKGHEKVEAEMGTFRDNGVFGVN